MKTKPKGRSVVHGGLTLIGTDGEDGISISHEISPDLVSMLRVVDTVSPSGYDGDLVDAVVHASDMLKETARGRCEKNVYVITDGGGSSSDDQLEDIQRALEVESISVHVFGVGFDDEKLHTEEQRSISQLASTCFSVEDLLIDTLRWFLPPAPSGAPQKFILEIGSFAIPTKMWKKTSTQDPIKAKLMKFVDEEKEEGVMNPEAEEAEFEEKEKREWEDMDGVKMSMQYNLEGDVCSVVDKEKMIKGYRYGGNLIPMGVFEEKLQKLTFERCARVVAFADRHRLPFSHLMGETRSLTPNLEDLHHSTIFSAFVQAMSDMNVFGIVRFIYRKGSQPHVCGLFPHPAGEDEEIDSFDMVDIPFRDDVREADFPPLHELREMAEKDITVMDDVVNQMMFGQDFTHDIPNPRFQYTIDCVHARALDPNCSIPSVRRAILDAINIPTIPRPQLDDFRSHFNLTRVVSEKDQPLLYWFSTDEVQVKGGGGGGRGKRDRADIEDGEDAADENDVVKKEPKGSGESIWKSRFMSNVDDVRGFNRNDPDGSMRRIVLDSKTGGVRQTFNPSEFPPLFNIMVESIVELFVRASKDDRFLDRATECAQVLRECSATVGSCDFYHALLMEWKGSLQNEEGRWIVRGKDALEKWIGLMEAKGLLRAIDKTECSASELTKEEASSMFFSSITRSDETEIEKSGQEENAEDDDLLDFIE
jgi:hypothetical protein